MSTLAAIDCGTNSTRLLISRHGETIDRRMIITRLGKGVDAAELDPDAIERTLAAAVPSGDGRARRGAGADRRHQRGA